MQKGEGQSAQATGTGSADAYQGGEKEDQGENSGVLQEIASEVGIRAAQAICATGAGHRGVPGGHGPLSAVHLGEGPGVAGCGGH